MPSPSFHTLTLPGICAYGVERWLEDYRPVLLPADYQLGYDRLFAAYARALPAVEENPGLHAIAIAEYKIPRNLSIWWFEIRRRRKLAQDGVTTAYEAEGLVAITDAVEQCRRRHPLLPLTSASRRQYWRSRLVMAKYNAKRHSPVTLLCPGRHGRHGYLLGDLGHNELSAYVAEHHLKPLFLQPLVGLGSMPEPTSQDQLEATDMAERFWHELNPASLPDGDIFDEPLRQAFIRRFAVNLAWFRQGVERLRRWRDGELLLTSVVHLPSRMFAVAWRHLGRRVTAFTHGNNYLNWLPASNANCGANLVGDNFVVSCPGEIMLEAYAKAQHPTPLTSPAAIECAKSSVFKQSFEQLQRLPPVREIRTVMVIGFSMDYQFYPFLPTYDTLTYAHLTLRLLAALRAAGYRVIYKDHPDTFAESAALFRGRADQILSENFTTVIHQADCLLFVAPYSTTLGYGLLSRIPAVIADNQAWRWWHPEILALLQRRTAFFPVAPDPHGILQFDPALLVEAIKSSLPLAQDTALVEKWAL